MTYKLYDVVDIIINKTWSEYIIMRIEDVEGTNIYVLASLSEYNISIVTPNYEFRKYNMLGADIKHNINFLRKKKIEKLIENGKQQKRF